ncbi:hypothetical protein Tco_0013915 [Tanacetum coccineum]
MVASTEALIVESDIPEVDMPSRKRLCLIAPTPKFKVGESSTAAAARQTRHTLARRVDYGFIDTLNVSIQASKGRVMTVVEEMREMEWQRQEACDMVTRAFGRIHALEARDPARLDDLEDTGSSC